MYMMIEDGRSMNQGVRQWSAGKGVLAKATVVRGLAKVSVW